MKTHLPPQAGLQVLEVGSAPGENLVRLRRKFGYDVYGVEYAEVGVAINRANFAQAGIADDRVIQADFFAPEFQTRYRERFDIVVSRGFIEHFDDVTVVLERHLTLLKAGGRLVVTIPRLTGINYPLCRFFDAELLDKHNLKIMEQAAFAALFAPLPLQPQFCGYFGTFSFQLFDTKAPRGARFALLRLSWKVQLGLNLLFRLLLRERGWESWLGSPHLMYVGVKKS
ncbi:MAG: class I SAM-dependent methyltransferase [Acidobacteria bacterium]|nr:class I SAM-dependent methyltransferase [Acidobacteriota bacterium]MBI3422773.1 class I SAM-dependent methyltransferase [Acidobacteriota bacterium]